MMAEASVPAFHDGGGLALALARLLFVTALLAAFGGALFAATVLPRVLARDADGAAEHARPRLLGLARLACLAALLACPLWLLAQAADMADATRLADALAATPAVLAGTAFGHVLAAQAALLLAAALVLPGRSPPRPLRPLAAAVLAGAAVALQAGHEHAWAMDGGPSLLVLAGVLHLLAAGAWLGGLLPLLSLVRRAPCRVAAAAARWYSPLGKACVIAIVASAAWQFWRLIGGLPGLVGTAYGWVAASKLALFGVLLGFALLNRYRLAPALLRGTPEQARRRLAASIAAQSGFGLLTVLAASVLGSLPPAIHEQPLWPFPDRFSLAAVQEDAGFRDEAIGAAAALAAALLAVALAWWLRRRARWVIWPTLAGAGAVAWLALPHLGLLLVPASPTYYWRSPTGFAAGAIARGSALFPGHCAACHGAGGEGNGPAAASLPLPPADLTAPHLWMHSDGEMFWWLTHGIEAPEGGMAMPGFAGSLPADDRWDLIDYVRAHNAGLVARSAGQWSPPLRAPSFVARCGGRDVALAGLRGRIVRLVFGAAPPADPAVVTILAAPTPLPAGAGSCSTADESVPLAYGIVAGAAPQDLAGTQFLIDGEGWLRTLWRPGAGPDDPVRLAAAIKAIRDHPVARGAGFGHDMGMPMNMSLCR